MESNEDFMRYVSGNGSIFATGWDREGGKQENLLEPGGKNEEREAVSL